MAESLSLMGVYAHPDDEQGVSGVFAHYARQGVNTTLIFATRGEAGEIAPGTNATPENLGHVREAEMRCAASKIGIRNLYFLGYRDSGMAGTPENEDPRSLNRANLLTLTEQVTRIVRTDKPHVMLTFDAWGGYGHPDHIMVHRAALMAFFLAPDERAFPEQLRDGLQTWTPLKLYFSVWPRTRFKAYAEQLQAQGKEWPDFMKEFERRALPEEAVTTRLNVSDYVDLKLDSLLCHATQLGPKTIFSLLPREAWREIARHETFILAESRTGRANGLETDLFAGLDGRG